LNTYGVPHHAYASARPIVTPETSHPEFTQVKTEIERILPVISKPAAPTEQPGAKAQPGDPAQPDAPAQPEKSGVTTTLGM